MIRWIVLLTDPPLQLHDAAARPYLDPGGAALEVLAGIGTLRASTDGEIPGLSVALDNAEAQAMPLLRRPPLGVEAVEYRRIGDENAERFRGVVTSVTCAAEASIEVSA